MTRDGDGFVLASGRRFYANCGALGMSDALRATEGYDGRVMLDDEADPDDAPEDQPFTIYERAEVAAYMVDLWERWARREQKSSRKN